MNPDERTLSLDELKDVGRHLLLSGKSVNFSLGGTSMYPFLRDGDVGAVLRLPIEELKVGQVVVFEQNGRWIAHRLVSMHRADSGISLLCQGDSILRTDKPIGEAEFLGVIENFIRRGKTHQMDGFFPRKVAWILVNLRPFPQFLARFFLRVKNRVFRA